MSNYYTYYTYTPQELPAPNNDEETPETQVQGQPTSGHFKTCYICGLDFSKYQ